MQINTELDILFSPRKIGNVQIKNRIVRSATFERRAGKYPDPLDDSPGGGRIHQDQPGDGP